MCVRRKNSIQSNYDPISIYAITLILISVSPATTITAFTHSNAHMIYSQHEFARNHPRTRHKLVEYFESDVRTQTITKSEQLMCAVENVKLQPCRWLNAEVDDRLDELDWYWVRGLLDRNAWTLRTGSHTVPVDPFLAVFNRMNTSHFHYRDPKPQRAVLVSDPIACQKHEATVRLNYWISDDIPAPTLKFCWKYRSHRLLNDCVQMHPTVTQHTNTRLKQRMDVTINGPIEHTFQLVIIAEGFHSPTAFIAIDSIVYNADQITHCNMTREQHLQQQQQQQQQQKDAATTDSGTSDDNHQTLTNHDTNKSTKNITNHELLFGNDHKVIMAGLKQFRALPSRGAPFTINNRRRRDIVSCEQFKCEFGYEACDMNPKGLGSTGIGRLTGWSIRTSDDGDHYLMATFPHHDAITFYENRYVLESTNLSFDAPVFVHFERFAIGSIDFEPRLSICADNQNRGFNCFWSSPVGSPPDGTWRRELIQLPAGEYKVYVLGEVLESSFGEGELALKFVKVFHDFRMKQPLC